MRFVVSSPVSSSLSFLERPFCDSGFSYQPGQGTCHLNGTVADAEKLLIGAIFFAISFKVCLFALNMLCACRSSRGSGSNIGRSGGGSGGSGDGSGRSGDRSSSGDSNRPLQHRLSKPADSED